MMSCWRGVSDQRLHSWSKISLTLSPVRRRVSPLFASTKTSPLIFTRLVAAAETVAGIASNKADAKSPNFMPKQNCFVFARAENK